MYKISQNLGENSIIYVHIDEPQLLAEQLNSVCENDTSIEIVKSFLYGLCCCAKAVFQKANVYLCVIVTGTFSYLSLLPERVDPHYLNLSLLNSKDVIDYLSKLFSKQKGFNQVVQKPIFTAYLEAFGLIPFLLPKIVEYFREISFSEFNYQHFHSVLSNILTNTIQLVDIVKDNKFLINLCYCSLLREQIIMVYSPLVNKIRSSGMFLELNIWGRIFPNLLIPMIIQITRQITEEIENSTPPLFLVEEYFTYEISYFEKQVAATIIIRAAGLKYLENITYFKAIYPGCTNFSIFNRELILRQNCNTTHLENIPYHLTPDGVVVYTQNHSCVALAALSQKGWNSIDSRWSFDTYGFEEKNAIILIQAKKWANEVPESDLNTFVDESRKVAVAFAGIVISILICTAEAEEPLLKLIKDKKRRKNNLFFCAIDAKQISHFSWRNNFFEIMSSKLIKS